MPYPVSQRAVSYHGPSRLWAGRAGPQGVQGAGTFADYNREHASRLATPLPEPANRFAGVYRPGPRRHLCKPS